MLNELLRLPWAIRRELAPALAGWLAGDLPTATVEAAIGRMEPHAQASSGGSIAVIPLQGVIAPRGMGGLFAMLFGGGGLDAFCAQLHAAENDAEVSQIVLDVDSPGGLIDMVPETAAEIRDVTKPVTAVVNTEAASAAYWLASQADEIVVTPSGQVGSIGVFMLHRDMSEAYKQMGVRTTLIAAGKYKTEGNPYEPLSDDARKAYQSDVDEFYSMFPSDVGVGRGVSAGQVAGGFGEGRMVLAREAVALGMADRVETMDETLMRLGGATVEPTYATQANATSTPMLVTGAVTGNTTNTTAEPQAAVVDETDDSHEPMAGPIAGHNTDVVDVPWDGEAQQKKLETPITGPVAKGMYAWYDSTAADGNHDGWPDAKNAYKFPHHQVNNSKPGAANVNGVRAALSRVDQQATQIPDADRAGVRAHLQHHLDAWNKNHALKEQPDEQSQNGSQLSAEDRALLFDQHLSVADSANTPPEAVQTKE